MALGSSLVQLEAPRVAGVFQIDANLVEGDIYLLDALDKSAALSYTYTQAI